jgi:ribosome-associated protein
VTVIEKTYAAVEAALEKKAYDVKVFEAEHLMPIADYFLIATGRSDVQCQAIARGIEERLSGEGIRPLSIEGFQHAHWIVMDYEDVVVHVFYEPTREFYRLETNWLDATAVPLPEPLSTQAKELRLHASG